MATDLNNWWIYKSSKETKYFDTFYFLSSEHIFETNCIYNVYSNPALQNHLLALYLPEKILNLYLLENHLLPLYIYVPLFLSMVVHSLPVYLQFYLR